MIKGKLRPINDNVLINDMNFGERTTKAGIVLRSDDGKDTGVRPRWGQVYAKGHKNTAPYVVGDWVYVKHGRWTRGFDVYEEDGARVILRQCDVDAIMLYSKEKPQEEGSIRE